MNQDESTERALRVAQIGCGYWGINLLRCLQQNPEVDIVGVAETSRERRKILAGKHPLLPVMHDYKDLLGNDIDALVIATPPATHFELAKDCLLHDKHVLVEKPMAMRSKEAKELINLADSRVLTLMAGHTFEYNSAVHKLQDYVAKGEIGEVYYIYMARLNLGRVQPDINAMWSLAPHDVSILLYVLQSVPEAVSARGFSFLRQGIEDVVFMILDFPDGLRAHIHVSWLDPNKMRKLTMVGSKKMIVYDDTSPEAKIRIYDKGITRSDVKKNLGEYDTFGEFQLTLRAGDVTLPHLDFPEPLQVECNHFIDCIRKKQTPISDGKSGLKVVQVLETAQKSLETGGKRIEIQW